MRHRGNFSLRDYADWHRLSAEEKLEFVSSLDRERNILKVINSFALEMISIKSRSDLAWYVVREVVGKLGFVDCVFYYLDPDIDRLVQHAAIGSNKNPEENKLVNALKIPVGTGITGYVAKSKKPIIIRDLEEDRRYIPDIDRARSEICVPILIDGETVGVIDCEDPRLDHFDERHMEILTTVAAMAAARLKIISQTETEALNAALAQEIENRIEAEERLQINEARWRDFAEVGSDWHWELDQDLCYTILEPNGAATHAFNPEDYLGKTRASVKPDEMDNESWESHINDLIAERPFRSFLQPRTLNDGTTIWLSISGKPFYAPDGTFAGYRGTATDVTEILSMEKEMNLLAECLGSKQ